MVGSCFVKWNDGGLLWPPCALRILLFVNRFRDFVFLTELVISLGGACDLTMATEYRIRRSSGPTLVFVHGTACSQEHFAGIIEELPFPCCTLTVDLAGHGNSRESTGPFTIDRFADEICSVLADEGIDNAILVGHSMGAAVCVQVAAKKPALVTTVIALDGLIHPIYRKHGRLSAFASSVMVKLWYRRFVSGLAVTDAGAAATQKLRDELLLTPKRVTAAALRSTILWDRDAVLASTTVRVVAIPSQAQQGLTLTPEFRARCEVREPVRGTHFYLIENPQETAHAIGAALKTGFETP